MAESHREEIAKLEALYAGNPGGRVFVHLAEAYRKAGEHERARRILDEGLARHTDSASGFVVLGRVLADMQIGEEAEVAFRRVLELDSGNLVALRWLGDLARQSGRLAEAVTHYRELLSRNPSNEEVRDLVEIVEREAAGGAHPPTPAPEPEWHEPEAAPQTPAEVPEGGLSPLSAAPGGTGEVEPADVEFGLVEIQAAEDVEEEPAYVDGLAEAGDSLVIESLTADTDDAARELGSLARTDEAEPLEIHLLDPSFTGVEEDEPAEDYAGDEFIADLVSAPSEPAAPDALDASVDVLGTGSGLTLQDAEPQGPRGAEPSAVAEDAAFPAEEAAFPADQTSFPADQTAFPAAASSPVESEPPAPAEAEAPPLKPHGDDLGTVAAEYRLWEPEPAEAEEGIPSGEVPGHEAPVEESEAAEPAVESAAEAGASAGGLLDRMDALAAEFGEEPEEESETGAVPHAEPAPEAPEPGPVTETMAELYRAQGFHERAAEVYRALLRQRPFDLRLSAKLSESEADAAGAAAERAAATPVREEEESSGDVWLRGVGAPWQAEGAPAADEATPYAWTPEPEEQPAGEAIGTYLKDLVSWKTAGQRWSQPAPPAPPRPVYPEPGAWSADDEPWATTPAGDVPTESVAPATAQARDPAAPADSAPAEARTGPETTGTEPPAGERGGTSEAGSAPAPEREGSDPWTAAPAKEPPGATPGWAAAGAAGSTAPAEEPEAETDDEDLEMFRSWLQSLKK